MLITGAGGAFGSVIQNSGIGDYLVKVMQQWDMPLLLLGYIIAQTLRVSLGSSTVALVTTSSILGPLTASLGVPPILLALAICAGRIGLSMPNDFGFWVVSKFAGLSVKDTLKSWSVGGFITGVTGLIVVYILSLGSGFFTRAIEKRMLSIFDLINSKITYLPIAFMPLSIVKNSGHYTFYHWY